MDTLRGALVPLGRLWDLVLAVALLLLCVGIGRFWLARFRPGASRASEQLILALVLGVGTVSTVLLGLGLVGGLRPPVLLIVLGGFGLAARRHLMALPGLLRAAAGEVSDGQSATEAGVFAALVSGAAGLVLSAFALAPPVDWDTLMYHLRLPHQFLSEGWIRLPVDSLRVSYANVIHLLYVPLLAAGSPAAPAVFSALFAVALALTVWCAGRTLFDSATGAVSLILLWGTATIFVVAITPRVDVTLAAFLLAGHFMLLVAWRDRERAAFLLSAAILGLAVGVKYHALPYIIALSPVVLWTAIRLHPSASGRFRDLGWYAALGLLCAAPWLLKNLFLIGAPLYPVLSAPQLTPWLRGLVGTTGLPPDAPAEITRIVWTSRSPFNLRDALFAPERLSIEFEGRFYRPNPALVLLPLVAPLLRHPMVALLAGPALGFLLILVVPYPETNVRYLLPAIPPLTIVVGHLLARAATRWVPAAARDGVLVIAATLSLITALETVGTWNRGTHPLRYLSGEWSAWDYATRHFLPDVQSWARTRRMVNDSVPAGSRLLMLFEDRGFGLTAQAIEDQNGMTWPLIADRPPARDCLAGTGVTHVLVGAGAARYYIEGGVDSTLLRLDELERFAERCLDRVGETGGHLLYRVAPAARLTDSRSGIAGGTSGP